MGYSLLFAQGWTWGNLIGEGIAAFLFAFLLVLGRRYAENFTQTKITFRLLIAGLVFFSVLISSLTSLGITELYQRSSGAPILTPIFGIFYSYVVGSYDVAGMIIAAQLIGALAGFIIAKLLRPHARENLGQESKIKKSGFREFFIKGILTSVLLCGVAVISLINPTSYGGTAVIKLLIMSFVFFAAFLVFGDIEFYSYTSLYSLLGIGISFRSKSASDERVKVRGFSFVVIRPGITFRDSEKPNKHLQALLFQFAALGIMIGIYALMQSLPGSVSISRVI